MNYHNEKDPYAAQWLRNLIDARLIAAGYVDDRSIVDVCADDLAGYVQCHFFAGIGIWPEAFRLAGWPNDKPVWSASCPCQPLSGAGQRKGHADERHLWPAFYGLVAKCKPPVIFGEQVASKDGREWFAGVRADLEALGYACGAADLCAASFGAPHQRQRLYWVADARHDVGSAWTERGKQQSGTSVSEGAGSHCADAEGMAYTGHQQSRRPSDAGEAQGRRPFSDTSRCSADVPRWNGPTIAIQCTDGWRRISAQSSSFPLVNGNKGRMGRLRAYGNAILPQVGAGFIGAYQEAILASQALQGEAA